MNWRLLTTINAIIALVTVAAVIFYFTRARSERSRSEREQTTLQSNSASDQPGKRADKPRIESPEDLANARVDDLGAVPAAALTELMARATPEQLAAMALKFNEAPTDARTFGGMGMFFQAWAQLDPKAALIGAFQIHDVAMRKLAANTVVWSVSPSAARDLIAYLGEHPDKDLADECKNEFLGSLISSWSHLDPEAASRFIDDLGDTKNELGYKARTTKRTTGPHSIRRQPSNGLRSRKERILSIPLICTTTRSEDGAVKISARHRLMLRSISMSPLLGWQCPRSLPQCSTTTILMKRQPG
jgi:hypothetical protein